MIKVELSGVKILKGYKKEELTTIKESLTYDNPKYESAKKHSRFGAGSIEPFVQYYTEGKAGLIVPRGYKIPFPYKITKDDRLINRNVYYPKLRITLRDTQKEAVESFIDCYLNQRNEHGVIILPTGKGKSILGLYLARKFGQRALIVVHKDDLVDGWTQDAKVIFGLKPRQVGLIKAKEFRLGQQVTLTTVQTLSKLSPEQVKKLHSYFGMVIVDEFHHSVANIYNFVNYFPARFKIGLTATAMRNDGLVDALYLHFGELVYEFQETADDEDILPVTVNIRTAPTEFNPEREYKYNARKKRPQPVNIPIATIRKAISFDDGFNNMLARDVFNEYKQGKSCIIFTHEKEHCRIIEETLIDRGIPPKRIQLYYGDSKIPKDIMKQRAESREVLITIATYSIATEGTNVKAWERVFLASTLANEKDVIQAIGRGRRTDPKNGKQDCIAYDYRFPNVISAKNHGKVRNKVYKERGFTVVGKEKQSKRKQTGRGFGVFRNSNRPIGRK